MLSVSVTPAAFFDGRNSSYVQCPICCYLKWDWMTWSCPVPGPDYRSSLGSRARDPWDIWAPEPSELRIFFLGPGSCGDETVSAKIFSGIAWTFEFEDAKPDRVTL